MNNIIIFEGGEKVGKTTYINKLKSTFSNSLYFKSFNIKDIKIIDMSSYTKLEINFLIHLYKINKNTTFLVDRSIWTEYVYSKYFNRKNNIESLKKLLTELNDLNLIVVYITCKNKKEWQKRFEEENQDINFDNAQDIDRLYRLAFQDLKPKNLIEIDTATIQGGNNGI